jgi:uncharacterized protein (TIGR00299 family) protein
MVLGALAGLDADRDELLRRVASLGIGGVEVTFRDVTRDGLAGLRAEVSVAAGDAPAPHRRLAEIRALICASKMPEPVKAMSIRVFERLADAEAAVHGVSPAEVHFHEVGAADAIVDIAGSCAALDLLDVGRVTVGPLPLGGGSVRTEHGLLPVPAPATAELLKGFQVAETDEPFETVTPTGAALLTTFALALGGGQPQAPGGAGRRLVRTSCAFGSRVMPGRPNILRARLTEDAGAAAPADGECVVLECNLDDAVPELLGALLPKLLRAGALDAFMTPVQMKKQRPGCLLTVLCPAARRDALVDLVFEETPTFGVREHDARRTVLQRRHVEVSTPYGAVRVKVGSRNGRDITRSPEHDDCARRAEEHGVPVRAVYEAALKAL